MNRPTVYVLTALCLAVAGALLLGGCKAPPVASAAMTMPGAATAAQPAANEAVCPVLGTKGKKSEMTPVEYKGTTYYFCCAPCVEKFKQDPEKYLQEGAKAATDAKCPVTGKAKPEGATCPMAKDHGHGAEGTAKSSGG